MKIQVERYLTGKRYIDFESKKTFNSLIISSNFFFKESIFLCLYSLILVIVYYVSHLFVLLVSSGAGWPGLNNNSGHHK